MMRELTARPHQPSVMTTPMAVPVMRGNASPTMASVVGKTGAMETPARKTRIPAVVALVVFSIRNVVRVIMMAAASVTSGAGTLISTGATATRPISRPSANPSERIFSARDSGMPCAIRCCASQFQTPTSQAT